MTPQEFNTLIENCLGPSTVMLAVANFPAITADDVIANGTGSLISTGAGKFLVTNYHVYKEFRSHQEEFPDAKLLMSGAHGVRFLDISKADPRGLDPHNDLAVLYVPEQHVYRQKKVFWVCHSWPPRRPEVGMLAAIYGYPGQGRIPQGMILGAQATSVALRVASVGEKDFKLVNEDSDAELLTPEGAERLTSLGGMSGSAVYVMTKRTETTEPELFLAGFMYEASISSMDFICVTYSYHINSDVTIH